MYFAYGWPKVLRALNFSHNEDIIHLSVGGGLLVVVSNSSFQLWDAGQHRVKLCEWTREFASLEEDGTNEYALWRPSLSSLAVLTSHNILHLYDISTLDKRLPTVPEGDRSELRQLSIRPRCSVPVPLCIGGINCSAMAADDDVILLGLSDGRLQLVSWKGQLRGSASLWGDSDRSMAGIQYLAEANGTPSTPHSPLILGPPNSNTTVPPAGVAIAHLAYSARLRLLTVVLQDGRVALCSAANRGLRPVTGITADRWIGVTDAVIASIGEAAEVLAVGSRRGTVELFNLADGAVYLRTISLFDWGYTVEDTGMVSCIEWSPDNKALAVGWSARGLAIWTVSGCRLMCSIRHGSVGFMGLHSPAPAGLNSSFCSCEPLFRGVAQVAWTEHGYHLIAAEEKTCAHLLQFALARGCVAHAMGGSAQIWQVMQGDDRLLLIRSDEEDTLRLEHLVIPHAYLAANWPLLHVAVNEDGSYLAAAGSHGLILYNMRHKKWRVFGDISQEKQVRCAGLLWLGRMVIVCNHRESSNTYELRLYPRYHLDDSSLLFRQPLPDKPIAMDCWQDYILVATMPFDIRVYHVHVDGELSPLRTPQVQVHVVRELSIMSARKPPIDLRFVPTAAYELDFDALREEGAAGVLHLPNDVASTSGRPGGPLVLGGGVRDLAAEAVLRQPTRCMLLRRDGELSLLDLDRGSERPLIAGVEHFWLTSRRPKEEAELIEDTPWWAYGHRGIQVWYPSSPADTSTSSPDLHQLDPELDFDREVYPLGVSPAAGVIVGVSQRLSLAACADMPCFEPVPQAQPILPCLLRHLLQRNALDEAVQLARLSATRPHFFHSLEWLLFTIFDAETTAASARKKAAVVKTPAGKRIGEPEKPSRAGAGDGAGGLTVAGIGVMLQRAVDLIRHFPEFLDVVVSVARKTDSRHWPELFSAAGKSTALFEECFEKKQYRTATCYILVVEKLEGPTVGQQNALRLLQTTLRTSQYDLAGELVRFLLRSGREYTGNHKSQEEEKAGDGILKSFFGFGFTSAAPKVRADVLHTTVKHILGDHATHLMKKKELKELVAFVKGTQFDFVDFLQSDRAQSAHLEDFPTALRAIKLKLGLEGLQSRVDAEFLLIHMRKAGLREWTLILATLLQRRDILIELFQGDQRLWNAYQRALKAQPSAAHYEDLLASLAADLALHDKAEAEADRPALANGSQSQAPGVAASNEFS